MPRKLVEAIFELIKDEAGSLEDVFKLLEDVEDVNGCDDGKDEDIENLPESKSSSGS